MWLGKQRGLVRCGKASSLPSLSRKMKHIVDYMFVENKQSRRTTQFALKCIPVLLFCCYIRLVGVISTDQAVPNTCHAMMASIRQLHTNLNVNFCFSVNYLYCRNVFSNGMPCVGINGESSSVITKCMLQPRLNIGNWSVSLTSGPPYTAIEWTWRNWYSMLSDRSNHLRRLLWVQWQFFYSCLCRLLISYTFSGQVILAVSVKFSGINSALKSFELLAVHLTNIKLAIDVPRCIFWEQTVRVYIIFV
jgi:hypothetical protein